MKISLAVGLAFGIAMTVGAQSPVKDQLRVLGTSDSAAPNREVTRAIDRLAPSSATGWHSHPGEMVGYVTKGEVVVEEVGTAPRRVRAGGSLILPAGRPHNLRNESGTLAEMFVVFVLEKGRSMSAPYRP